VLEDGEFLIIAATDPNYYVQFAGHGTDGMRAEAVSNTYLTGQALLSDNACQALQALGWRPPTYVPGEGAPPPATGSPNFFIDARPPVPYARLATLAVRTLRTVYRIQHPQDLRYKSFFLAGGAIRLPMLGIPREAKASDRARTPGSPGDRADLSVTGRFPDALLTDWPGAKPIAAEVIEGTLRRRVTQCEAALEDSVWQLARFYSMVNRAPEAMDWVRRLLARTHDPTKQAGGYLGLGQLLEQQDRYAEAAMTYNEGLAIRPAAGPIGYLLHNNRGYCLNRLGRHAEAEAHCRAAIEIDPTRHNAHKNLGLALAGQGRYREAARSLLEADRRWPADGRARRHLAELLAAHPGLVLDDADLAAACRLRGLTVGRVGCV
jgi:tetratricopeptide (TPR) repeat protein